MINTEHQPQPPVGSAADWTALVSGVAEVEPTARGVRLHRLPGWVRQQFPDPQLIMMESQASGARLTLRTDAGRVALRSRPSRPAYRGADRPRGAIDVFVDGERVLRDVLTGGDVTEIDLGSGETTFRSGAEHVTVVDGLPAGDHRIEFWLPHNESLELLELTADGRIRPGEDRVRRRWLHHGSSISHGSNAAAPSDIWPAVAARAADVELINLGLGGSALVDPFLARVIRDTPADLISVKLGINVVNLDAMHLRAFVPAVHGFLDTIRDGHPDVPIVLISPVFCPIHEDTPGPGAVDPASLGTDQVRFVATGDPRDAARGRLTLRTIRTALAELAERRADDPALHYLDGTRLYGAADFDELPLPDGLHPDPAAHLRIGRRFADYAFASDGPFAAP